MADIFAEHTKWFLDKMQIYYPTVYQSFYQRFLERACTITERVGEDHGVQMTFDTKSFKIEVHDSLNQGYIDFLKNEAHKRIKDEFSYLISALKIQEMIELEKLEGG